MRALVISGGGSKGAFAGGVAEFLLNSKKQHYDMYIGTSTGSLLISHLAVGKVDKIKEIYTNVGMSDIFNINPFKIKKERGFTSVSINHFNVLLQFLKRRRTFGESKNLLHFIQNNLTREEFQALQVREADVVITVTNISTNASEYKSIHECTYEEYCEWIWISCNYIPFMSLVKKNGCEYGDGGFSNLVPINEAIARGATEIDVIILESEHQCNRIGIGRNPFSLLIDIFRVTLDQIERYDITLGKMMASIKNVQLNLYYTPIQLTDNALVFDRTEMQKWWKIGFDYAKSKNENYSEIILP